MTENITVNTHSSIRIEGEGVLYFDPFGIEEERHDADAIFITHDHYDHFSPEDIAKVKKETTKLLVPVGMLDKAVELSGIPKSNIIAVQPGQLKEVVGGCIAEMVPSYNKLKPFHPKRAEWCGYIVTVNDIRYYIAGDTDDLPENHKIKCDVALVPIGGTYTMNAKEAAGLVNAIRPQVAIPTHYGSIVGKKEDGEKFRELVKKSIKVEFKINN